MPEPEPGAGMPSFPGPLGAYRLLRPLLFSLPPETAHHAALRGLALTGSLPGGLSLLRAVLGSMPVPDPALRVKLWGRDFPHPLGVAAGLDKDGVALSPLLALGFSFVEAGTVTPLPQPGNPRPRLFRLPGQGGLINRMGFNNAGAAALAGRLALLRQRRPGALVGVNLGKNKDTPLEHAAEDYRASFDRVYPYADFITVNVSSPNTPGLRDLQTREALEPIVSTLAGEREKRVAEGAPKVPLLVKVAPDLDEAGLAAVVEVVMEQGCDGLIAVNTTLARPGIPEALGGQAGGLSGKPLGTRAVEVVSTLHRMSQGRLPLIGVGGVFDAEQAYALIRAGAGLVQAYTGFIYRGPGLVPAVLEGLTRLLQRDGFASLGEAVGTKYQNLAPMGGRE